MRYEFPVPTLMELAIRTLFRRRSLAGLLTISARYDPLVLLRRCAGMPGILMREPAAREALVQQPGYQALVDDLVIQSAVASRDQNDEQRNACDQT
ncbi:MAG: hypothetical protein ACREMA_19370 [Longimicrobiales bacterium]